MMVKYHKILILSWSLILMTSVSAQKYAVITGIGNYPKTSRWNQIHTTNDRSIIENLLLSSGFQKENITILAEEQATRRNIISALTAIHDRIKPGDLVYFHFSGHGQQVEDFNGDEPDGLDEALVPYDAPKDWRKGVFNHITDDMLDTIFTKIREKLGVTGHLFVTMDACHSGTSVRGGFEENVRGTGQAYVRPDWSPKSNALPSRETWFRKPAGPLAPMVVITASMAHQLNWEYEETGSLTWALSKAMQKSQGQKVTYRTLFDRIRNLMATVVPQQTPTLEIYGADDLLVFDGARMEVKSYFEVDSENDTSFRLAGGTLQGLYPGAGISVFAANTYDTTKAVPLARGVLTQCELVQSAWKPDRKTAASSLKNTWAYLNSRTYGSLMASVNLKGTEKTTCFTQLQKMLRNQPQVELVQNKANCDIVVLPLTVAKTKTSQYKWLITNNEGTPLDTINLSAGCVAKPADSKSLLKTIYKACRARYLRQLDVPGDTAAPIAVSLVVKEPDTSIESGIRPVDGADSLRKLRFNTLFSFRFENRSRQDLFFNLIDIQGNNEINVIFPRSFQDDPDESRYFIRSRQSLDVDVVFQASPPAGKEIFKLTYSDKPLRDIRQLSTSRGDGVNPMSRLLSDEPGSRGLDNGALEKAHIGIQTFYLEFVP